MQKMSLNGAWRMRTEDDKAFIDAQVPGSVYADYLRAGRMEDPFYRDNELAAYALMEKNYVYEKEFSVDPALFDMNAVLLRCEGLDTLADIELNGEKLAEADNMHRTWMFDVTETLKPEGNLLRITFFSPTKAALAAYDEAPMWGSTDAIPGFGHIRKTHCMYGWDWGPRLPDAGIWRDIELWGVNAAYIDNVLVYQEHQDGHVHLDFALEVVDVADPDAELECQVTVTTPGGEKIELERNGLCLHLDDPQLWWPSGYGEQPLYEVEVRLFDGEALLDSWKRRIGLRTMELSHAKDEYGEEFCHVVNGVKVFAMGADYIPEDNIFSRINPERTRRLLEDARLANFNAIRVWGGGYYPDDYFYDICDELGLLVWQDFMFCCSFYDLTPEFEASITAELEDNVKRLRHHASLALFCGNNEMEQFQKEVMEAANAGKLPPEAAKEWRPSHPADYIKMNEYIFPKLLQELAPEVPYWPSSSSSGGAFDDPMDPNRGDMHYWDVWHGEKPFTEYRKFHFRYASEFGFQSFPCKATIDSFTLPEDRNIFSPVMERHQRNQSANGKILKYISSTYRYPESFEMLLYTSQLLQADAIRYGVEHWRRNRGRCMGAVIWQLNDCWPVASWSSIDYYGRWKALHYVAKRFFAPVMISACEEGEITQQPSINEFRRSPIEKSVTLSVANETGETVNGTVRWALCDNTGRELKSGEFSANIPPRTSRWFEKLEFPEADMYSQYVRFSLEQKGAVVQQGTVLFCAPKHFSFIDPKLAVRTEGDEIIVAASAYASKVALSSEDPDLLLEDNYFDLNGGERRVKILRGAAKNPRAVSVYDIAAGGIHNA